MNEKQLQENIAKYFGQWFEVYREVSNDTAKSRIDIVLIHKSEAGQNRPIGIEVKLFDVKTGSAISEWVQQANRYAKLERGQHRPTKKAFGPMLCFVAPAISENYFTEGNKIPEHAKKQHATSNPEQHNFTTFLGGFGIGEVKKDGQAGYKFVFNGAVIYTTLDNYFNAQSYDRKLNEIKL